VTITFSGLDMFDERKAEDGETIIDPSNGIMAGYLYLWLELSDSSNQYSSLTKFIKDEKLERVMKRYWVSLR
jgi:hypothetical protein